MEKEIKKMTSEELNAEFYEFLANSTPEELAIVIQEFERGKGYKSSDVLLLVKAVAFRRMLKFLNIRTYTHQEAIHKTKLDIDEDPNYSYLFLSKQDKEKDHLVYPKLFDQHKDELLQIIETRRAAILEKKDHSLVSFNLSLNKEAYVNEY